jgi:hypothetical protein
VASASKGITAAQPSIGPTARDYEESYLLSNLNAPAEVDPAAAALEEQIGVLEKQQPALQKQMNVTTKEGIAQLRKDRIDAGIPDLFQVEKDKLRLRKERGEESEKETAQNNLIRFLTRWGTIPGSTMRGMIGAGAELVDKMDIDAKHKQKFLNELDDIDSRINNSEYALRIGDEDRVRKEKDAAGKKYLELAEKITDIRAKEALKDKDLKRSLQLKMLDIEKERVKDTLKGPKTDEYFTKIFADDLTASDPKKYPPGPATDAIAAQMYLKLKAYGTVTAAGIGQTNKPAENEIRTITAKADESRAKTDAEKEQLARLDKANTVAKADTQGRGFRNKLKLLYETEGADTPAKKEAIKERETKKVYDAKKVEYKVNPSEAASAPAAAPKKDSKGNPPVPPGFKKD